MRRLRMAAAVLALLTALLDLLIAQDPGIHKSVIVAAALAAVCLGIVTPFNASKPPERKRVVFACAAFLVMIGVALACALLFGGEARPLGAMAVLTAAGIVLLIWAYKTRNRVRRSVWHNYFDR